MLNERLWWHLLGNTLLTLDTTEHAEHIKCESSLIQKLLTQYDLDITLNNGDPLLFGSLEKKINEINVLKMLTEHYPKNLENADSGTECQILTHLDRDKKGANFLTTFSNAFLEWKYKDIDEDFAEVCFQCPLNNIQPLV